MRVSLSRAPATVHETSPAFILARTNPKELSMTVLAVAEPASASMTIEQVIGVVGGVILLVGNIGGIFVFLTKIHAQGQANKLAIAETDSNARTRIAEVESRTTAQLAEIDARHSERMAELKIDLEKVEGKSAEHETALAVVLARLDVNNPARCNKPGD
jgi:hypothetical protein